MRSSAFLLLTLLAACPGDSNDSGDASTGASDPSAASEPTGGAVNFDCDGYCTRITANCTGAVAQYSNKETCLSTCANFDTGAESDMSGNTLGCRLYHAGAAASDPTLHCSHAGPGGNGQCGSNCDGFCAIVTATCPAEWPDPDACLDACADLGDAEPYDAGDLAGDTLACRIYHATVATMLPADHCAHTLPLSETCV